MKKIELYETVKKFCDNIHHYSWVNNLRKKYPHATINGRNFLEPIAHLDKGNTVSVTIGIEFITFGLTGRRKILNEIEKAFEEKVKEFVFAQLFGETL